jgi:hypothetical protein
VNNISLTKIEISGVNSKHFSEIMCVGGDRMHKKEYNYEGTRVIIHSPIANLSDEERAKYMRKELAAGNPVLKEIEKQITNIWRNKGK